MFKIFVFPLLYVALSCALFTSAYNNHLERVANLKEIHTSGETVKAKLPWKMRYDWDATC